MRKEFKSETKTELAKNMGVSLSTLKRWSSGKIHMPEKFVPKELQNEVIDRNPDNWGQVNGGKKTYKILIKKYGKEEIRKRQSKGGRNASKKRDQKSLKNSTIDLKNPLFLEFYGALIGDGWLGAYKNKKRTYYLVGFSGDLKKDEKYHRRISKISEILFGRKGYIKEKPEYNARELIFGHKQLVKKLNSELGFPIGIKKNLKIHDEVMKNWDSTKYVIRGLFDTDGSFYIDNYKAYKTPYPVIDITSTSAILLEQVSNELKKQGFNAVCSGKSLKIKGRKQAIKWFTEIQPQNERHLQRYEDWNKARMAQPG